MLTLPNVTMSLGARSVIWAQKGFCFGAVDFSQQELMTAAVLSQDPVMLKTFREPERIINSKGIEIDNPLSDLHCLTTRQIFSDIFHTNGVEAPQEEWLNIAKNEALIKIPGKPRDKAKGVNFGIIYFQTALSLTESMFVPLEYTHAWVKGHQQLYSGFHAWAKEEKQFTEARGWARSHWGNRIRFCNESNAKGAKESTGIMGVNHKIQAAGADLTKESLRRCDRIIKDPKWIRDIPEFRDVTIIGQVHDEIIFHGPGNLKLDLANSVYKKGVLVKPKWIIPASVHQWLAPLKQQMVDAETECFNGLLPGRVGEPAISQFWAKE